MHCYKLVLLLIALPVCAHSQGVSITTEDAKNTTVVIQLSDSSEVIRTHYHLKFIDTNGGEAYTYDYAADSTVKSAPQAVPAGTYDIRAAENDNIIFRNVPVLKDKKNTITGYLKKGVLSFEYDEKGETHRPVTDFGATIVPNGKPMLVRRQRCGDEVQYPTGNYYIEVNSLPLTRFNVDIDWNTKTTIRVQEPGYAEIINNKATGAISFLQKQEKTWTEFHQMNAGVPGSKQKLRLQPGKYEIHWLSKTDKGEDENHVQQFTVKSNSLTEVNLGE